jgi:hypothetical protein
VKQSGDQHGDTAAPEPGARAGGSPTRSLDDLYIVPLDGDFDIDSVFQSEPEPVEAATAPAEAQAAESLILKTPEPIVDNRAEVRPPPPARAAATSPAEAPVPDNLVRFEHEAAAPGRARGPALSIADLIENHVQLEWHEAVAIAQHLCQLMARDPAASVHKSLVEPWNVEITDVGDVHVLPGGSSSDPLVKQVGRVLRALLQDSAAPAELRLVASQASFDVPVYSGVDELSAALRHFERPGISGAIRAAFNRGVEAKFSAAQTAARTSIIKPPPAGQTEAPRPAPSSSTLRLPARSKKVPYALLVVSATAVAAILISSAVVVSRLIRTLDQVPVPETRVASAPEPPKRPIETPRGAPAEKQLIAPIQGAPPVVQSATRAINSVANALAAVVPRRSSEPAPGVPPAVRSAAQAITGVANAVAAGGPRRPSRPEGPPVASRRATPEPRSAAPASTVAGAIDAQARQAADLLASGRADEAAMFFDSIVLKNPLYRPDPARMSAEALSAFRNSKRTILTAMVRSHYQDGRAAFDAGDFSLAITEGERARALLKDLDDLDISVEAGDVIVELRSLLTLASAARTAEEEKVYTLEDSGVTPPRPLGRQLSAASMSRISLRPTGHLEILVGRSGRVEAVKLDTPMNGYHDRMLVSAVKAWHYKPAIRNGKPVRFSLMMTIRLPDL